MPKIKWELDDGARWHEPELEPLEPPPEGWHKPCEFSDHKWTLEIEEGRIHIACVDPCDINLFDPRGKMPTCRAGWESDDFNTPEPIPVNLVFVNDSSPSGPWGPAEYNFWIDVTIPNG